MFSGKKSLVGLRGSADTSFNPEEPVNNREEGEPNNNHIDTALNNVVKQLIGIQGLYQAQEEILKLLIRKKNIIYTAPTNSGE